MSPANAPTIPVLSEALSFPDPRAADAEGLVAVGGDLSVDRLRLAYREGIFPWFSDDWPIAWWCPDPRFVLAPSGLRVSRSLQRVIRSGRFRVTADQRFGEVIRRCRHTPREGQDGTWITSGMVQAYEALHAAGDAHSVEVWEGGELVGGLYGVAMGRCFFGESMFAAVSNASKVGFVWLVRALAASGVELIDCQVHTDHLGRFGATMVPRDTFLDLVSRMVDSPTGRDVFSSSP